MAHVWMSHGKHMHESCHTYESVMSHVWMSHVKHMNESWHTYEWVRSHIWKHHVIYMNKFCHTYEWVVSQMSESCHVCMRHVTHQTAHVQCNAIHCNTLRHTATRCNTLQHTATHCNTVLHTGTYCNTLQHTATHCSTLQHTSTLCNTLQHTATHLQVMARIIQHIHTATHCSALQNAATRCNTLQHTTQEWRHRAWHATNSSFEELLVPYQQSGYSTNNLATVPTILQNRLYSHCWYWKVSLQIIYNLVYPLRPDARHEYRTRWSMGSKKKESERAWGGVGT